MSSLKGRNTPTLHYGIGTSSITMMMQVKSYEQYGLFPFFTFLLSDLMIIFISTNIFSASRRILYVFTVSFEWFQESACGSLYEDLLYDVREHGGHVSALLCGICVPTHSFLELVQRCLQNVSREEEIHVWVSQ